MMRKMIPRWENQLEIWRKFSTRKMQQRRCCYCCWLQVKMKKQQERNLILQKMLNFVSRVFYCEYCHFQEKVVLQRVVLSFWLRL